MYDASLTLVLDITKQLDVGRVAAAVFFTHSYAALATYYTMHLERLGETVIINACILDWIAAAFSSKFAFAWCCYWAVSSCN